PLTSSLTATPALVVADGVATTTLRVVGKDALGNALVGESVLLTATGSSNAFTPVAGLLDANGVFTSIMTSTLAQVETVTATLNGHDTVSTLVTFTAGPAATAHSTISASPTTLTADGVQTTA